MVEKEDLDGMKKLSPQERIKKLKELQKKNKKEIEDAQKMLSVAEDEAHIEEELKEIPIPQLKAVDIDQLFTQEEKELFKTKTGKTEVKKEEKEEKKKSELEDIADVASRLSLQEEHAQIDYIHQLSEQPAQQLYSRAKELYSEFKERGYLTETQQQEFQNIKYANQQKMQDAEQGKYADISKRVASDMILIERMNKSMYQK